MDKLVEKAILEAPKIPFGAMPNSMRDTIRACFSRHGIEPFQIPEEYWQQTIHQGREVVQKIKAGGFVVGGELNHGNSMDGYGVHVHVYSRDHSGLNHNRAFVKFHCDYPNVIGSVDLWESWGFLIHPVSVWYNNSSIITDSIELRNYLESQRIDFRDSVDRGYLFERITQLNKETNEIIKVLSSIEGLTPRK